MGIVDFILSVLIFVAVFAVMIVLYSKISRLFKKKSYHYIVPPTPEKDKNWQPVDFTKYECFIFIYNSSEEFIIEKLNIILNDENKEIRIKANDIELNKQNDWVLIKIKASSFVDFKSLVRRLDDFYEDIKSPASVVGFCRHKSMPLQDYLFKKDKASSEEYFIGSFRNGKNFGIYLPNAGLCETGNISLSPNQEVNFYSETSNLPVEMIESEMTPYEEVSNFFFR